MRNENYTGMTDGDLGLLDRTVSVMMELCDKWMDTKNEELCDAALKMKAITEHMDNLFRAKLGGTIDLVSERSKLGYID